MESLKFIVPYLPKTFNSLAKKNIIRLKAQERRKWERLVWCSIIAVGRPTRRFDQAKLTCVRFSSRCPDYDGLVSSFKFVIDALVKLSIIKDDNMQVIGMPDFRWKKCKPNHGHIEVTIEEI